MARSIRTLPIVERWDCHGCSICCRGSTIPLNPLDLQRLQEQGWHQHPEFRGVQTVVRASWLSRRRVLAKKRDGSCVFLSEQGRCRIHEQFGGEAKPDVCQIFPLQVVPLDKFMYLTPRRACPSAAADQGRPIDDHLKQLRRSRLLEHFAPGPTRPPRIAGRFRRSWPGFLQTADALSRLTTDENLPLVRRLIHGLRFCELLAASRLDRIQERDWSEFLDMLTAESPEEAGVFFRDRQAPAASTGLLFRQLGVHYLRMHPDFTTQGGWRERWRMFRALSRFARGKGHVPALQAEFPAATFADLERPLGPLQENVTRPLGRFFESHALSKQYAIVTPGQSLVESFRSLALTFPLALWLLRLAAGEREPTVEQVVQIVVALERGQGSSSVRRAAMAMADTQELQRVIAWYAR